MPESTHSNLTISSPKRSTQHCFSINKLLFINLLSLNVSAPWRHKIFYILLNYIVSFSKSLDFGGPDGFLLLQVYCHFRAVFPLPPLSNLPCFFLFLFLVLSVFCFQDTIPHSSLSLNLFHPVLPLVLSWHGDSQRWPHIRLTWGALENWFSDSCTLKRF